MTESEAEFDRTLRSLVLSPEETLRRDALREKIYTRVAKAFEPSASKSDPFVVATTR